ncbi:MAG: ribosome recycling factor [Candidatus Hydrothermota bacterium]|nr:MAG: ribosome recycling factor [Candidatus Hydrothermae bacterium]
MDLDAIYKDAETRMQKSVKAFKSELKHLKTGRATPALLEDLKIEYYGSQIEITKIASVVAPEPRLLVIQPWDKTVIGEIVKAIQKSGLGLNPQSDGNVVRVPIPPLSEDSRRQLVKLVGKLAEDARIAVRNIRRDAISKVKRMEKEKQISEDDRKRAEDKLNELTQKYTEEINKIAEAKEKEIMES